MRRRLARFPCLGPFWGGGVCYNVVPAGGIAPDPSTPFAAKGPPKSPPPEGPAPAARSAYAWARSWGVSAQTSMFRLFLVPGVVSKAH